MFNYHSTIIHNRASEEQNELRYTSFLDLNPIPIHFRTIYIRTLTRT